MDVAAFIISIVALAVAVIVAINEYQRDYTINKTNLEAEHFNEIYKEFLIKRIPNARKYIFIDTAGMLKDTEKMREELNSIRQDSLYYLYNDEVYYQKLKSACQDLEDYLVGSSQNSLIGEEQTEFYNNLQRELKVIYKIINNKYLGKK